MKTIKLLVAAGAIAISAGAAHAASLTGDTVTLNIADIGYSSSALVGAGAEFTVGNVDWDVDFGANGDELVVTTNGNFGAFGATSFELTSLDFSGGEVLVGFSNLFSQLANTVVTFTSDSILFSFDNGTVQSGVTFSGKFETAAANVPLPAGLPLAATGLGLLAFVRNRRKS